MGVNGWFEQKQTYSIKLSTQKKKKKNEKVSLSIFPFVQIIHSRFMNIIDENQVAKASQDSLSIHELVEWQKTKTKTMKH